MKTSRTAAALALSLLSGCGLPSSSNAPCDTPLAPAVTYQDCKAGEQPTLRAQEWACVSTSGVRYSYVRFEYVPQGYRLLVANGTDVVGASGADIPQCYRGTSTSPTAGEKCSPNFSWTRCGGSVPQGTVY